LDSCPAALSEPDARVEARVDEIDGQFANAKITPDSFTPFERAVWMQSSRSTSSRLERVMRLTSAAWM